jgi:hypothetical protein
MYGETRQKAIAELRTFIEDLRAAYMNAANGQATQQPTEQPQQGGMQPGLVIKHASGATIEILP